MAEYLSPGVFVEERNAGPSIVQGVSTSNLGACGWLQRGPVGEAVLITGFDDFVNQFGTYWANSYIPYAMAAFFQNGGSRAYIVREVPADADIASGSVDGDDTSALFQSMAHAGTIDLSGAKIEVGVNIDGAGLSDINVVGAVPAATTLEEIMADINAVFAGVCSITTDLDGKRRLQLLSTTDGTGSIVVIDEPSTPANDAMDVVFGITLGTLTTVTGLLGTPKWTELAISAGTWGNLVKCCLIGDDNYRDLTNGGWDKFKLLVSEESADGGGDFVVQESLGPFTFTLTDDDYFVDVVNDASSLISIALAAGGIPWELVEATRVAIGIAIGDAVATEFSTFLLFPEIVRSTLTIVAGGITLTDDGEGVLSGTGGSGTIDYITGAISLEFTVAPADAAIISAAYISQSASTTAQACAELSGGLDGTAVTRNQISAPGLAATERGIYAMDKIEDMINVIMPDFAGSVPVANDMIAWAEARNNRFLILDPASGLSPQQVKDYRQYQGAYNTSYAALYWPWVTIQDPLTLRSKAMPPSGFAGGVYARTDSDRNVAKAPAGINDGRLVGAIGLEYDSSQGERDILYPFGINCLVDSPPTGRAIWGARTLSLDLEWRYVQVRRLFLFLEQSTFLSTHWAVFENNGPGLWARIRLQMTAFLTNLASEGYFASTDPALAFRVVCDATNNNQAAIDQGLVTCDIYVATNKPAEFVRFRFQQIVGQTQ
jgi:phage tail sheath protein FI